MIIIYFVTKAESFNIIHCNTKILNVEHLILNLTILKRYRLNFYKKICMKQTKILK